MIHVLFVTYDGPEQAYLESLFLPMFAPLHARGFRFHVLQSSWGGGHEKARAAAERYGMSYAHVPVMPRMKVLATAANIAINAAAIRRIVRDERIDVVMPRSTICAAMTLLARPARVAFDADGLVQDERVDFAGWSSSGALYRIFRDAEAEMVRRAQSVVTRTTRAKATLIARAGAIDPDKIFVIPNAKDEALFSPGDESSRARTRAELGASEEPLVVYAGSLGPQYFPDEMLRFFAMVRARRAGARFVLLTGHEREAHEALARSGASGVTIKRVAPDEVPRHLAAADLALALRAPTYSQHAVSPIKVGEYLLCGVPVLATSGVGDLDAQLGGVGRMIARVDRAALESAADWLIDEVMPSRAALRQRARAQGVAVFGLGPCVDRYERALRWAAGDRREARAEERTWTA